jgi:hypothetical protein
MPQSNGTEIPAIIAYSVAIFIFAILDFIQAIGEKLQGAKGCWPQLLLISNSHIKTIIATYITIAHICRDVIYRT